MDTIKISLANLGNIGYVIVVLDIRMDADRIDPYPAFLAAAADAE